MGDPIEPDFQEWKPALLYYYPTHNEWLNTNKINYKKNRSEWHEWAFSDKQWIEDEKAESDPEVRFPRFEYEINDNIDSKEDLYSTHDSVFSTFKSKSVDKGRLQKIVATQENPYVPQDDKTLRRHARQTNLPRSDRRKPDEAAVWRATGWMCSKIGCTLTTLISSTYFQRKFRVGWKIWNTLDGEGEEISKQAMYNRIKAIKARIGSADASSKPTDIYSEEELKVLRLRLTQSIVS